MDTVWIGRVAWSLESQRAAAMQPACLLGLALARWRRGPERADGGCGAASLRWPVEGGAARSRRPRCLPPAGASFALQVPRPAAPRWFWCHTYATRPRRRRGRRPLLSSLAAGRTPRHSHQVYYGGLSSVVLAVLSFVLTAQYTGCDIVVEGASVPFWLSSCRWPAAGGGAGGSQLHARHTSSALPAEVEVVVIGAGLSGAGAAYNLAQRGVSTLLVDARGVSGGASGAAECSGCPNLESPRLR